MLASGCHQVSVKRFNLCQALGFQILEHRWSVVGVVCTRTVNQNVYFLCIAGLQVSGYITPALDLSPTHKLATLAPLTVMVSITMIKEAIEDIARHREDGQVSTQPATVMLGRRQKRVVKWRDVKVGQVLEVRPA